CECDHVESPPLTTDGLSMLALDWSAGPESVIIPADSQGADGHGGGKWPVCGGQNGDVSGGRRCRRGTPAPAGACRPDRRPGDRESTRLNSSHVSSSYAVFCL